MSKCWESFRESILYLERFSSSDSSEYTKAQNICPQQQTTASLEMISTLISRTWMSTRHLDNTEARGQISNKAE